jgi:hypothetical protein
MAIQNPCSGSGQEPVRIRVTSRDLGTKFGGRKMGCCPVEGCDARVTPSGKLAKHEVEPGEFMRIWNLYR